MKHGFALLCRFALGPHVREARLQHAHLHVLADFHKQFLLVNDPHNLTDQATLRHHRVALRHLRQHCLMFLHLLLLRRMRGSKNTHDQNERQDHADKIDSRSPRRRLAKAWEMNIRPFSTLDPGPVSKSCARYNDALGHCKVDGRLSGPFFGVGHGDRKSEKSEVKHELLERIANALERLAPPAPVAVEVARHEAFVWRANPPGLEPVSRVNRVELALLRGIDLTRDQLLENTRRFAKGLPANNALLWGARGMGKSSLVKAAHKT